MRKMFRKLLLGMHFRNKSDKNVIFLRRNAMFNIWQINFLLEYALMFYYYNKQLFSALALVGETGVE